jgi:hypothetical protein
MTNYFKFIAYLHKGSLILYNSKSYIFFPFGKCDFCYIALHPNNLNRHDVQRDNIRNLVNAFWSTVYLRNRQLKCDNEISGWGDCHIQIG